MESKIDLQKLNEKYRPLSPEERIKEIYHDFDNIMLTSSFGTTAVFQLHLFYKQGIRQPVHFIDTTYHFKETLAYKAELTKRLNWMLSISCLTRKTMNSPISLNCGNTIPTNAAISTKLNHLNRSKQILICGSRD